MQEVYEKVKIAIALRMARAAIGWSQDELAEELNFAKTTIARAETMDGGLRIEQLAIVAQFYKSCGVEIDFLMGAEVTVKMTSHGVTKAMERLLDMSTRRVDRRKAVGGLTSLESNLQTPSPKDGGIATLPSARLANFLSTVGLENVIVKPAPLATKPKRGRPKRDI
jgi:transcriptional regulator with XRE-family HTH domain